MKKECRRCGECCRWYIPSAFAWTADLKEYYEAHGFKIVYHDDGKPKMLLIPVTCPHLVPIDDDGEQRPRAVLWVCDIFDTRPEICRDDGKKNYYHPPGCSCHED